MIHLPNSVCNLSLFLQLSLPAISPNNAATDVPILRSCYELKLAGYRIDGKYRIDPDGPDNREEPFAVVCDMKTGN